jgi:hypothetical protein
LKFMIVSFVVVSVDGGAGDPQARRPTSQGADPSDDAGDRPEESVCRKGGCAGGTRGATAVLSGAGRSVWFAE